ncbi:YceI family protein [Georgenia wangjunii]|uniref:YceI family protein n=1 Tax=Georgenia wangjunii TaxID=3117730 RepID=UPI002F26652E
MAELDAGLAGDWLFDPAHSRIGFSARHAMVTKVRGAFNDIEGRIHVDPRGASHSFVTVRLRSASVDTRNPQRDGHLRSADFFDVDRYPDIVFTSTMVDEVEDRMYMVVGDLTIRGITKEIAIPIERRGVERDADGELRAGFEGTRRVDRREWGLEWQVALDAGGVLVSERITLEFEISAVKVRPEAAAETPAGADSAASGVPDPPAGALAAAAAQAVVVAGPDDGAASPGARAAGPDRVLTPAARSGGRHRSPTGGWLARLRASGGRE